MMINGNAKVGEAKVYGSAEEMRLAEKVKKLEVKLKQEQAFRKALEKLLKETITEIRAHLKELD